MSEKKNRKKNSDGGTDSNSWMVTFSDLSTLLLTFFVLLLSMASMDDLTLKSLFHTFTSSCGVMTFKEMGEIYRPKETLIDGLYDRLRDSLVVKKEEQSDITAEDGVLELRLKDASGAVVIQDLEDGFKIVFGHEVLFESGSAQIKPQMLPVLERVGKFMRTARYQVYVDGHTDNVPIRSRAFASNEALSLARAYGIIRYFVKEEKVSARYLALGGYGAMKPVASNDQPSGRAKNRRVELIFKNQTYF